MYDFDKEKDSEFLREAGKLLQERVLNLEKELVLARLKNEKDEAINVHNTYYQTNNKIKDRARSLEKGSKNIRRYA